MLVTGATGGLGGAIVKTLFEAGADGVVPIAPSLDPASPAQLAPFVASAKAAGVSHLLFISAFGTNHSEQSPLRIIEHIVIGSGIPCAILRPNFFMQNFSTAFLSGSIRAQNAAAWQ